MISELTRYASWVFFSVFFIRYLINAIENQAPFGTIMTFIGICFVVFGSLSLYSSYFNSVIVSFTDNKIYRVLYKKLYAKARNVELRCFEDTEFYDHYTMALDGAAEKMTQSTATFISASFGMIAAVTAFYYVFTIDAYSILFVIAPIMGNFVLGSMLTRLDAKRYEDSAKNNRKIDYVNRVMYLADFAKEIRYSSIFGLMLNRYRESVEANRLVVDKYARKGTILIWIKNTLLFAVPFEGIMFYAAYRAMVSKTMGLAELAVMFSAMVASSWILIGLFGNIIEGLKNGQFLKYFRAFMEYKEKIPEDGDGVMPDEKVRNIEFRNICFEYKPGEPVIKNLSFHINGDKVVALVGHNGAGKTTIIKLLFRLYDPTEGEILVNGINIKQYDLKAYRKLFAAAFQDYKILSMSIRENILMGVECENGDAVVRTALKHAGILDRINALPNGIDTVLTKEFDKNGAVLSGGEVQTIIVARAFTQQATVKVFDEPSSALDPIAEYDLYCNIMKQSTGQITLFVSHRLSSARAAALSFLFSSYLYSKVELKFRPKIKAKLKEQLYMKAKEIDLECYDNPEFYNEYILAVSESDKQVDRMFTLLDKLCSGVISVACAAGFILVKDWASLFFVAVSFMAILLTSKYITKLNFKIRNEKTCWNASSTT